MLTTSGLSKLLGTHKPASMRTAPDDAAYVIAYPSLNLDEMSEVAALHREAAEPRGVPIVTVNAELERIRSGCAAPAAGADLGGPPRGCASRANGPPQRLPGRGWCRALMRAGALTRAPALLQLLPGVLGAR